MTTDTCPTTVIDLLSLWRRRNGGRPRTWASATPEQQATALLDHWGLPRALEAARSFAGDYDSGYWCRVVVLLERCRAESVASLERVALEDS